MGEPGKLSMRPSIAGILLLALSASVATANAQDEIAGSSAESLAQDQDELLLADPHAVQQFLESIRKREKPPDAFAQWVSDDQTDSATGEQLLLKIESLNLGPSATIDDLRARDQLVSKIAGIRDPIQRDELLTRLEERERRVEESKAAGSEKD